MAGTLYHLLGVAPDSSPEALRAAHRRRARHLHPEGANGDAAGMRALNEAWAVLSDPQRRAAYDRSLAPAAPPDEGGGEQAAPHLRVIRLRLWPFLILGAGLLVVATAYAGRPAQSRMQGEGVGQCLVEGGDLDRLEPCRAAGGRRVVADGGPGLRCPAGTETRALRGGGGRRTVCVAPVAGR